MKGLISIAFNFSWFQQWEYYGQSEFASRSGPSSTRDEREIDSGQRVVAYLLFGMLF